MPHSPHTCLQLQFLIPQSDSQAESRAKQPYKVEAYNLDRLITR